MMSVQCPKCYQDKPLGAKVCPNCVQQVTSNEVFDNEVVSVFWLIVIGAIIWFLIT